MATIQLAKFNMGTPVYLPWGLGLARKGNGISEHAQFQDTCFALVGEGIVEIFDVAQGTVDESEGIFDVGNENETAACVTSTLI